MCKFGVSTCLLYVGFCEVDGLLWRAPQGAVRPRVLGLGQGTAHVHILESASGWGPDMTTWGRRACCSAELWCVSHSADSLAIIHAS